MQPKLNSSSMLTELKLDSSRSNIIWAWAGVSMCGAQKLVELNWASYTYFFRSSSSRKLKILSILLELSSNKLNIVEIEASACSSDKACLHLLSKPNCLRTKDLHGLLNYFHHPLLATQLLSFSYHPFSFCNGMLVLCGS